MKKTPWFPASIKPIRDGIYECNRLETGGVRVTRMLRWGGDTKRWTRGWFYTDDSAPSKSKPGDPAIMFEEDGDKWRGIQGDEHSCQIGASTYAVEFSEGPDRHGDEE